MLNWGLITDPVHHVLMMGGGKHPLDALEAVHESYVGPRLIPQRFAVSSVQMMATREPVILIGMDSTDLQKLVGARVVAQSSEGRVFAGQLSICSQVQFEIQDDDGVHHLLLPLDIESIREAPGTETRALADLCTCSDDDISAPECPLHMTEDMRDIVDVRREHGVCLEVPARRFRSARVKLERAARAMLQLQREASLYNERAPRTLDAVEDGENIRFVLRIVEPMPDQLPALASTAIHNLRSCLDCIAWNVSQNVGSKLRESQITFTFTDTKAKLTDKEVERRIAGIGGKDWQAFVNAIGPCEDRNEALWILHRLDIIDKHRDLVEIDASPIGIQITSSPDARAEIVKGAGFYSDGDVVATCRKGYHCSVTLSTRIVFKEFDRFRSDHVMDALRIMHGEVCKILSNAEKRFPCVR